MSNEAAERLREAPILAVKFLPPERERLLEAIQRLSLRSEGNPLDWTAQHRLWWEKRVDAALAAERKATVERIRAEVSDLYGGIPEADGDYAIGYDDAKDKVLDILDAEVPA